MVSEEVVVSDNIRGRMQLIGLVDPDQDGAAEAMQKRLQERAELLQSYTRFGAGHRQQRIEESDFVSEFGEDAFKDAVKESENTPELAMSCRWCWRNECLFLFKHLQANLYRALRSLNPSPYVLYESARFQIVSSSPEILARLENGVITNRPLAVPGGAAMTRPRTRLSRPN